MLPTVTEVVFDMVALILQGVEGFVLDFPARPAGTHQLDDIGLAHEKVGDPAVVIGGLLANVQPVLEEIHQIGISAPVEGHLIEPSVNMPAPLFVAELQIVALGKSVEFIDPFKQHLVIGGFGHQDI